MTNDIMRCRSKTVAAALWMGVVAASCMVLAAPQNKTAVRPIPPQATPYGLSFGELGQRYWKWMFSLPDTGHPAYEQGEVVSGLLNQPKHYFILESGNPGTWEREVQISPGKGIFFTLGDGCWASLDYDPPATVDDLLAEILEIYSTVEVFVEAELDGQRIDIRRHFTISDPFMLTVGEDPLFGAGQGTGPAIAAGWFVMLPPLSAGSHTMRLKVEAPDYGGYFSETTYHINVR